jgi:amyloid beta precursor protein binding protein 1
LVIGSSATSTSILKNLVLPGIGHYTILDNGKATAADIGSNFFLEEESLDKNRAEECVRLLSEMNDNVEGLARVEVRQTLLQKHQADCVIRTLNTS